MTTSDKGNIFISYRRADSAGYAGRIYDRLTAHFGKDAVFMDVNTIEAGLDFVEVLQNAVQSCDVLIALIGRRWLDIKKADGKRRLDNPDDFVRIEVAAALEREIRVIPVLVDGVLMPRSTELPENLKPLARRNALQVDHNSFNSDVRGLISQLERALKAAEDSRILKAKAVKEAQEHAQRQAEIGRLFGQADLAISSQDWQTAFENISEILDLESIHEDTQGDWKIISENISATLGLDSFQEDARGLLDIIQRKISENDEEHTEQARQEREAGEKATSEERARLAAEQEAKKEREERKRKEAEEKARKVTLRRAHLGEASERIKNIIRGAHKLPFYIGGGIVILIILGYFINSAITPFAPSATPKSVTTIVLPASASTEISPSPTPVLGVGSLVISEKDGMTVVFVPAGEFQMGSENGGSDEKPIHTVYLDAFWIDQTEVTNAMYAKCVAAGECDLHSEIKSYTRDNYFGNPEFDDYPVINVSWDDAKVYCEWAGRRLPTEAEWEKAAGWDENVQAHRVYPWGDMIDESYANYNRNIGDTTEVGTNEKGASFYGAYDMAGNVWEWVSDWYGESYFSTSPLSNPMGPNIGKIRVIRGGAWLNFDNYVRSASRHGYDPSITLDGVGFRCASDATP